jgi:hypothetical protein
MKKKLEQKLDMQTLATFCRDNAESIVGCKWINSQYCLKSCRYYEQQKKSIPQESGTEYHDNPV